MFKIIKYKKIRFPLLAKSAIIMMILGVAPLVITGIRTVNINKNALRASILRLHTEIATSLSERTNRYVTETGNEIHYITKNISAPGVSREAAETALKAVVYSHPGIIYISIFAKDGREIIEVFNPVLKKQQNFYGFKNGSLNNRKFISSNKSFETGEVYYPDAGLQKQYPHINLFYRLPENTGALIVLKLKPLLDEIESKHFGKSGRAFLINKDGSVISNQSDMPQNANLSITGITANAIKSVTTGYAEYRNDKGIEMTGSYAPVKGLNWFVIVQEPKNEAYYSNILMKRQATAIIIFCVFLSGGIAFFFARHLTSPVHDLIKAADRISQKDFSARVNPGTNDELNDLVTKFNEMCRTLEEDIERVKDDFMHSVTHDLRNPMTSIRGFLKFLMDGMAGPISEKQRKMIGTMDVASTRLLGMINDILDLAKLKSGRMNIHLAETDLKDISQHILEFMEPQFAKKSINTAVKLIDSPKNTVIKADAHLIERVINNLVDNAVKFTPEKGNIEIGLRDVENGIELTVTDNGEGIPPEYLDKVFDKFQQVEGQRKGGTGLGLTICKYIVESHLGKIWVKSKLNGGASFGFYISKGLFLNQKGEISET